MKTLKDLTPELRAKIPQYISKAKDDLYSGKEYETNKREDTVKYIEEIYRIAGQKKPVVIIAENPAKYKLFFKLLHSKTILKKIGLVFRMKNKDKSLDTASLENELYSELDNELDNELQNELDNELENELQNELYSELDSELSNELRNELDNELDNELSNELSNELRNELYSELDNELDNELSNELRNELRNELYSELSNELSNELDSLNVKSHWLYLCSIYSRVYLTWYYFIHKELGVETSKSKELTTLYNLINKTFISRCYFTKGYVLVLKTPKKILRNEVGFNSIDSPAIQYNGYGMHYVNGRRLDKTTFYKVLNKEYTFEDFLKEPNEDVKSAVISLMEQKFGEQYSIDFIKSNLKEIDTYVNKKEDKYLEGTTKGMNIGVYTLFKGQVNNIDLAYVRCYCPSTDRMFYLGVHDSFSNAKDAIASLYRVPRKLANHIKYIQRQGERFSTVFDKQGTDMLKNNTITKKDVQDVVSIDGNNYFSKMRYEY